MALYTDDACFFSSVVFETSWLWLLPIFLQSNVVWYAQREGRGICKSAQVFISGWNRSFARAPVYRSPSADGTGYFDGGGPGLATERRGLSAHASSAEGTLTYLYASGKASGKSTAPQVAPPSSSATFHALQCGSQGYFARDVRGGHRCARVVPRGVGPPPFTGRVDVSGAADVESPVQSSPDMKFLVERRFIRRMRKRTTPSESGCPVHHRRTLPVLNMWHRPRKAVNRELHALNGNTSSSVSTPILPVQGLDPTGPTVRMRIHRKRSLDMSITPEAAAEVCEERYSDELDGAGTLKDLLQKEVSLFLVELNPHEIRRDGDVPCPFCPWFRVKFKMGPCTGMCSTFTTRSATSHAVGPNSCAL